jgi:hypothetical protein
MIYPKFLEGHRFAVFSDASKSAIGAVVYVVIYEMGSPSGQNTFGASPRPSTSRSRRLRARQRRSGETNMETSMSWQLLPSTGLS